MPLSDEEVAKEMAKLGKMKPDAIAAFFKENHIVGKLNNSCFCPLAIYFAWSYGTLIRVHGIAYSVERGAPVPLPTSVAVFIGKFDAGLYPYLEMPTVKGY